MNIYIIGCGGIGSYLSNFIYKARDAGQIPRLSTITVIDFDIVEQKNLTYQNFNVEDIGKKKSYVIGTRYNFNHLDMRIDKDVNLQLDENDIVICCVDNNLTRIIMYEYCKNKCKYLDLRSKGKIISIHSHITEQKTYMDSVIEPDDSLSNGSCQNDFEFKQNKIQYGNVIVAAIGLQYIVDMIREETGQYELLQVI